VDFGEPVVDHEFSIELANTSLKFENSEVCWNSQIDNSVVKSDILLYNSTLLILFFFLLSFLDGDIISSSESFCSLIKNKS